MTTFSIILGLLLIMVGIIIGGYVTLIVEREDKDKARAEGYNAGLKDAKKSGKEKPDKGALKRAERDGYARGHADATAEAQEALEEKMSAMAEELITQGYESGLEAKVCESELVLKGGKVRK